MSLPTNVRRRSGGIASSTPFTASVALLRIALQAMFLLLLPRWVDETTASVTFLVISMAAFINPAAALGSQFNAIKAAGRGARPGAAIPPFGAGMVLAFGLACGIAVIYRHADIAAPAELMACYVLINYVRSFADAVGQGAGRYNLVQVAYTAFWLAKVGTVWILFEQGSAPGFGALVCIELVCSCPWFLAAAFYVARHFDLMSWRQISVGQELSVTFATLVRTAWMEADRLLLPFVVSPSTYVAYTVANRSATVGIALVSAHLGVLTPHIVRAKRETLPVLWRSGRRIELLALTATLVGDVVVLLLYPHLAWQVRAVMAVTLLLVPAYLWAHIFADFAFYHLGAWARAKANVVGFTFVAVGVGLVGLFGPVYFASIGQVLACLAVLIVSKRQVAA